MCRREPAIPVQTLLCSCSAYAWSSFCRHLFFHDQQASYPLQHVYHSRHHLRGREFYTPKFWDMGGVAFAIAAAGGGFVSLQLYKVWKDGFRLKSLKPKTLRNSWVEGKHSDHLVPTPVFKQILSQNPTMQGTELWGVSVAQHHQTCLPQRQV